MHLRDFFHDAHSVSEAGYRFFTDSQSNDPSLRSIGDIPMTDPLPLTSPPSSPAKAHAKVTSALSAREAAEKLEATFLAEMLKSAGFGKSPSFGGGIGEDQFASFQRQAMAEEMVKSGGIGLAESFYMALVEKQNDL